jgi:YebC/PmpR family DNA-binding regulatory protein
MAGHSKWANIKFRKAAQDNKRGKLFTKLIREITTAARLGGGEPSSNPRLRTAIDKALAGNMTRDVIERAVKRGIGSDESDNMEEIRYEGYGPGGVAIMVDCLTDNKNRTVSEVRHAFTKHGGNLGTNGSVAYLFNKVGQIVLDVGANETLAMEICIEAGALDIETQEDGSINIEVAPDDFIVLKEKLVANGFSVVYFEVTMLASVNAEIDEEDTEKVAKLMERLEDLDDVQEVYANCVY